ncbi:hypothetical protein BBJ29_006054 [Phytophthora kernoviae]|uniref:Uncharacterized protein n=1 Tax=Phytophthora kernoviae TaxID=325452 RepID=A0A3F2RGW9_9STRA|nr:hypothetical protein BBJ29_006054 [Phytophthora kernoviae]RLN56605.1 hypothetical protein BBP00_00007917 [Phytophthora kernoviae]
MPPEADAVIHTPSEKEEKQEVPFLPPPTPKRRAAVRASAKICAVVADVDEIDVQSPRIRRSSRRVQVAVGTTDEASESKRNNETADLVLDVEIEGREPSNDEADDEGEQEESAPASRTKKQTKTKAKAKSRGKGTDEVRGQSKRKRKMKEEDDPEFTPEKKNKAKTTNKGGVSNKSATVCAGLPPSSGHGGLSSPMRKKLGAIFRQRVEQRAQLEQMTADQTDFQQPLQVEAMEAGPSNVSSSEPGATENDASAVPIVSSTAAADEYQRQLQQYYYHQQVMLASSLSMSVSCGDDPSAMALHGGIIDPRIIQERLTVLEERRRQQAQIQAYYRQLMLTRERNVRALAANQAFMASSAAVWEQQLKEMQSEDDAASIKSWKDVTDTPGATDKETEEAGHGPTLGENGGDSAQSVRSNSSIEGDASDGNDDTKESETSTAIATKMASPDTVEKTAEGSASTESTPAKSVKSSSSGKCDPADTPAEVLYEFVL